MCRLARDNHHPTIAKPTVQNVADWVSGIAYTQEQTWKYASPELDEPITSVVLSMMGPIYWWPTTAIVRRWWAINISLYHCQGERQHTIYLSEAPNTAKPLLKHATQEESHAWKPIVILRHFIQALLMERRITGHFSPHTLRLTVARLLSCHRVLSPGERWSSSVKNRQSWTETMGVNALFTTQTR